MAKSGPKAGMEGTVEGAKGKAKQIAGAVTGDDGLEREGQAQRRKAAAQRDVAANEAKADKSRVEARAHEAEQAAQQRR
jgi:uncharacterized protein YjbJ (UPF0337 family)